MINAAGTRIHAMVAGSGPLVVLVHGFPESWYSWRHQITPIADAGFTVCAIDVRGYGKSAKPPRVADYAMEHMVADVVGVADAFQPDEPAIIVGHDWGAPIVWNSALTCPPNRFRAVAALAAPYAGVPKRPYSEEHDELFTNKDRFFYQVYFREVGRAEHDFDRDPRDFLRTFFYSLSGEAPEGAWPKKRAHASLLEGMPRPERPMAWMSDADIDHYFDQFAGSGFFGAISRYRNHEADYAWLRPFADRRIEQPALFIAGERDHALTYFGSADPIELMRQLVPDLRGAHVLPGCGHWTQQERPNEVTGHLLNWLKCL